ncbi:hypothetical protein [Moritella viscosa]|uniref:Uncharacterized protein n=1 Tax=Moritella viscosa TaxID=80854 RepID=A0ABY1HP02_9GAMM|nr:hypothetical protein [Moritella viscosa]SGZ04445.1 Putative uncharacterized protein [Moritella viscosa]
MKKYTLMLFAIISSTSALAKVTEADVARDMAWLARQNPSVPQSVIDKQWELYNDPPNEVKVGHSVSWAQMPAGSSCGLYQVSFKKDRSRYKPMIRNVSCQGHNVSVSCPSGFRYVDHLESINGSKKMRVISATCIKN